MSNLDSIMMLTDSYKTSHWVQYPPGTEIVRSYFESRGGEFPETVFFGLQTILKKYLKKRITQEQIDAADGFWTAHGMNFNKEGWESILKKHGGRLPVSIKAVPEGTVVPTSNVLMTIENTDPEFFWLTNYLETLLVQVWYPCTVATQSREIKKVWKKYLDKTGDPAGIDFKHHDFGFRGVSCPEQAGIGAAAHLTSFQGTDTIAGPILLREYYGAGMAGFSIPASEHSTITSWGRGREYEAFANMLDQYPEGLVACVSDSFNIFDACAAWGSEPLRSRVLARDGTLVIRPDSGYPPAVVIDCLQILCEKFDAQENEKGYLVLPPQVRMIQGDGITLEMTENILSHMESHGYSADNLAMGSGGGLLQMMNRDTSKYAFKANEIVINGEAHPVFKDPVTDPDKKSKQGRLMLWRKKDSGELFTVGSKDSIMADMIVANEHGNFDHLVEVFRDGDILQAYTLDEVRERVAL